MSAQAHYHHGDLAMAVAHCAQELRNAPEDIDKRILFTELLCARGEYDRADRQLEAVLSLEPAALLSVTQWRHLLRAATCRRDVFDGVAVPTPAGDSMHAVRPLLQLLLALREERLAEAAAMVESRELERPRCPGRINGRPVDDMRDASDPFNGIIELLATNGSYFWVDQRQVISLHFERPQRPLEVLWRPAEIVMANGSTGRVFMPATYPVETDDDEILLGRRTDWIDSGGVVRGVGQRIWLAGDEAVSVDEMQSIEFDHD
jgi:type VI secretion system protein ImpE